MRIALCALGLMVCVIGVAPLWHQVWSFDLSQPGYSILSPAIQTDLRRLA